MASLYCTLNLAGHLVLRVGAQRPTVIPLSLEEETQSQHWARRRLPLLLLPPSPAALHGSTGCALHNIMCLMLPGVVQWSSATRFYAQCLASPGTGCP